MQTQKIVQNIMKFRFYRKIIINIKYLLVAERFVFLPFCEKLYVKTQIR